MNKKNIPNTLTFLRIALSILLYPLAYFQEREMFLGVFLVACLTDGIDGYLARKWKTTSEFGAKWDTIADQVLIVSCAPWVYWMMPFIDLMYYAYPLGAGVWILLNNAYSKRKHGRYANLHLYSAKVGTFLILGFVFWLVAFGFNEVLYWIATGSLYLAALEVTLVIKYKKKFKTNMKSFFFD